jgi:hypothetical protein
MFSYKWETHIKDAALALLPDIARSELFFDNWRRL